MIVPVVMTMIFFIIMNVFQSDFPPDSEFSRRVDTKFQCLRQK